MHIHAFVRSRACATSGATKIATVATHEAQSVRYVCACQCQYTCWLRLRFYVNCAVLSVCTPFKRDFFVSFSIAVQHTMELRVAELVNGRPAAVAEGILAEG